jgi:hypothetical protein
MMNYFKMTFSASHSSEKDYAVSRLTKLILSKSGKISEKSMHVLDGSADSCRGRCLYLLHQQH